MADATLRTPYDSARLLFGQALPNWINATDASRLASYDLYEDIYWSRPETFKLVMRGTNEHPIYLPSGRIICNTMNRYVARGYDVGLDPDYDADEEMLTYFRAFFRREQFKAQFKSNKLYGVIRGDSAWLITANADKPEGRRVSLTTVHPGTIFPIKDEHDNVTGVDIIEQELSSDNKVYIKRQRWLRGLHPDHPHYTESALGVPLNYDAEIAYQLDSFELDKWETEPKKFTGGESVPLTIIAGITNLPIYTWKNFQDPESDWGSSELRGVETLLAGLTQAVSDEDLALAIAGLGNYWTNAGPPVDDNGNPVNWGLGPAEVVEIAEGKTFGRLPGITSVDPSIRHMEFLQDQAYRVNGASDVAQGRVDVQMAESGIALQLRMSPILDEASDKDDLIISSMDQMLYDLRQWFDVYEGYDWWPSDLANDTGARLISKVGPKLPEDKEARRKALFEGLQVSPPIFSYKYVRDELRRMGWEMPDETSMSNDIIKEQEALSGGTDSFDSRLQQEQGATLPAGA